MSACLGPARPVEAIYPRTQGRPGHAPVSGVSRVLGGSHRDGHHHGMVVDILWI